MASKQLPPQDRLRTLLSTSAPFFCYLNHYELSDVPPPSMQPPETELMNRPVSSATS